ALRLDRRLSGLAKKRGFAFTRYADDLIFSGNADRAKVQELRILAARIITEEGFMVNTSKTRVATQSSCQTVTGVVVNKILGLSRQQRRRLRAMAHRLYAQPATGTVPVEEIARF